MAMVGVSVRVQSSFLSVRAGTPLEDSRHLSRAVELAESSLGLTAPHPNSGCVIVRGDRIVGEGYLYAQGTKSAELKAVEAAAGYARGATAYLNLESGDCDGDDSAIIALTQAGVSRIVVGVRHPLLHLRGKAIAALRSTGATVDVGGEELQGGGSIEAALKACQVSNAPLLYRASHNLPMSTLKYAMTLDGKIAASSGHAAWVSSEESRRRVFETRAKSDAVVVGGNTVRRDNYFPSGPWQQVIFEDITDPSLTTRREGGHQPARIVMSRCLNLPTEANLWDTSFTQTIVMTQKGANKEFQKFLAAKGVEVVEFDFLSPRAAMEYCYLRGYLSVMWECGGMLSAPAIQGGVIHKVLAFIAPKIVGGLTAPTPVGELGMVQMTQALKLSDVDFEKVGPDMLVKGYLQPLPNLSHGSPFKLEHMVTQHIEQGPQKPSVIRFNKPWDMYGAFSNYSPHPITLKNSEGKLEVWDSVEHFYQAQKFAGVKDVLAAQCSDQIKKADSPEEAARLGRVLARRHPSLVRQDWDTVKVQVMLTALQAKFLAYPALRSLLLSTEGSVLVESSQNDPFWGASRSGVGLNQLGRLLMDLRLALSDPFGSIVNGHSKQCNFREHHVV